MSWSGSIVDANGDEVALRGDEAKTWRLVADGYRAKHGVAPMSFENGVISLSSTYVAALKMGYSISTMDLSPDEVKHLAECFAKELPRFREDYPERAAHGEYLVSFFKTAALFNRGIVGGH